MGIHLTRDSLASVRYAEGLNSTTSSVLHQRTDRHEIVGAKSADFQRDSRAHGPQSVRRLAARTGLSNSSVQRHTQAMAGRNRHPESWWWKTAEGRGWLIRLLVATLFIFGWLGLKRSARFRPSSPCGSCWVFA
jgi:hypothetical protein